MNLKVLIMFILLCLSCCGLSQDKEDIILSVLSKSVVGKTIGFNLSDKNELFFYNTKKSDYDQSLVSKIDFSEIPKSIFLKCNGELGDSSCITQVNY
ncbi:hypothetical protein ACR79T_14135 [Sphingobacterium spiritivorum]|uniref:hypothetical protein n=1 Tax=Sphingobacterium spiritivorum TaxID=258 RepID=UPI003DA66B88